MQKLLIKLCILAICIVYSENFIELNELALISLAGLSVSILLEILDKKLKLALYLAFFIASIFYHPLIFVYPLILEASTSLNPYYLSVALAAIFISQSYHPLIFALSILAYLTGFLEAKSSYYKEKLSESEDAFKLDIKESELAKSKLLSEKNKDVEIAILSERNRIAKEIHDSVGHTIAGSIMQAEALKAIADESLSDEIEAIQANLKSGMADIRSSLHDLHDSSIDLELSLKELLENQSKLSGKLRYKINHDLKYEAKYSIISIAKEAIANTLKHSDASEIELSLIELKEHISLSIKDNGTAKIKTDKLETGLGMTSFKEFAKSHSGRFSADFEDGAKLMFLLEKESLIKKD